MGRKHRVAGGISAAKLWAERGGVGALLLSGSLRVLLRSRGFACGQECLLRTNHSRMWSSHCALEKTGGWASSA